MAQCVKCDQPAAVTYAYQSQGHENAYRYIGIVTEMCAAHFNQLLMVLDRFVDGDDVLDVKPIVSPPHVAQTRPPFMEPNVVRITNPEAWGSPPKPAPSSGNSVTCGWSS